MVFNKNPRRHSLSSRGIKNDKDISSHVKSNPNTVIFFSQKHCGGCKTAEPVIRKEAKKRGMKVKKVNVDGGNFRNLKATPTVRVYKNGRLVNKKVGLPSPQDFGRLPSKPRTHASQSKSSGMQRVGCIGCSTAHIGTTSAVLNEAIRFANEGGVLHPEVVRRVAIAIEEITAMERIDLSEDAIRQSPKRDQELAKKFQPRIRQLRQHISDINTVPKLKDVSIEARELNIDFTKANMGG